MLINSCVLLVLLGPYTLVAKAEDIHRTVTTNDPASIQAALDAGEDINKVILYFAPEGLSRSIGKSSLVNYLAIKILSNHVLHLNLDWTWGTDASNVCSLEWSRAGCRISDQRWRRHFDPRKDGYTPMHGAGFQGRAEIAKMLIDHGLDPHDVHEDGFTPFHRALWGRTPGHTHTVEVFLKAGASPTQTGGYPPAEPINMAATPATKKLLKRWMKEASSKPEKAEL